MFTCSKRYDNLPAAHRQHNHDGHCALIHESWRSVVGFERTHEISSFGKIRRKARVYKSKYYKPRTNSSKAIDGQPLRPTIVKGGYRQIQLWVNGSYTCRYLHRLVVEAFNRPIQSGEEVNHIDGDPSNNHLSNLEIVSHSQNMLHSVHVLGTVTPPINKHMKGK